MRVIANVSAWSTPLRPPDELASIYFLAEVGGKRYFASYVSNRPAGSKWIVPPRNCWYLTPPKSIVWEECDWKPKGRFLVNIRKI